MRRAESTLAALLVLALSGPAEAAELRRHTVTADGHPMALWEKSAAGATEAVLLVHGRTWSALPDFDLQVEGEDLSLMDGLTGEGYAVFAVDLRGYGETPRDDSGWLTPNRAADDVAAVLEWISDRRDWRRKPHLFGWSMGSTISQLAVQRHPGLVSSLTLFGYWRDVDAELPADEPGIEPLRETNMPEAAASDFITPGSIRQTAVDAYVVAALTADPVKVDVRSVDQYNALDESLIRVPTLVIAGEYDPIAPPERLAKLFTSLGTGHKQYVSVPGGDHAAFLETPRPYFLHELVAFLSGVGLAAGTPRQEIETPSLTVATLCAPEERVVFSCGTTQGDVASICSSRELTAATGYLQYRFGRVGGKPEFVYPPTQEHPRRYFTAGTMTYSGGGGAYLKLNAGEDTYAIFTGIGKGWESEGVVVSRSGEQTAFYPCHGPWTSEIGPALFEQAGIARDPDEMDFEIP